MACYLIYDFYIIKYRNCRIKKNGTCFSQTELRDGNILETTVNEIDKEGLFNGIHHSTIGKRKM